MKKHTGFRCPFYFTIYANEEAQKQMCDEYRLDYGGFVCDCKNNETLKCQSHKIEYYVKNPKTK